MIGEDFSWGLLTELKQTQELAGIPIVVVSTLEDAAKAKALGADEFASKPIDRDWLLDTLDHVTKGVMRKRVLVIDYDEIFRYVIRQELAGENVHVLEAATGSQGLERAGQERLDLVLLDLNLPDMSGYDVLSRVEITGDPLSPVVIVSGMKVGVAERLRLKRAAAIVPKSEVSKGRLRSVMSELADRAGAAR